MGFIVVYILNGLVASTYIEIIYINTWFSGVIFWYNCNFPGIINSIKMNIYNQSDSKKKKKGMGKRDIVLLNVKI
jgi:hypothetical protein